MDKLTRKELKTDKFAQEVTHSIEYVTGHRRQMMMYVGAGLALIVVAVGIYFFRDSSHQQRQKALAEALRVHDATIGPPAPAGDPRVTFPTKEEKLKAMSKAFQDMLSKYPGSAEAGVSALHLAASASAEGNIDAAAKHFEMAANSGDKEVAACAKLALGQIYQDQGKLPEAEKVLRSLMDNPTLLVSKEQATLALARLLGKTKLSEARKLIEPLEKDKRMAVSRNAALVAAELPAK